MSRRPLRIGLVGIICSLILTARLPAQVEFFNDGQLVLLAANPAGVGEPPVPIFHNNVLIAGTNHRVVEAFDQAPGSGGFPLTYVDLVANTFLRLTYQKADGSGGRLGTSVVGTPSYRTSTGEFRFVPTVLRGDVFTDGSPRYESEIDAAFGSQADVLSTRRFPDPVIGKSTVDLTTQLDAVENIPLATGPPFPGNDRFRMLTVSSMFADDAQFDANMVRYETSEGIVKTLVLTDQTPRDQHLLPAPDELGSWLELVKGPGSTWFPDSPTVRINLVNRHGLRLGVQGFLAGTQNPNDDSLSVWLEWLDVPDSIAAGTSLRTDARVIADVAEFWRLNWPQASTNWLRDHVSSLFVASDGDCQWHFRVHGTPRRAILVGPIHCDTTGRPAFAIAVVNHDSLSGVVFQLGFPPIVRLEGTRIQGGPAE